MKLSFRFSALVFMILLVTGCAWYQGPELQADASGSLDGSQLNRASGGTNFFSILESGDKYGSGDTGYADSGGNYETTDFDNVT